MIGRLVLGVTSRAFYRRRERRVIEDRTGKRLESTVTWRAVGPRGRWRVIGRFTGHSSKRTVVAGIATRRTNGRMIERGIGPI